MDYLKLIGVAILVILVGKFILKFAGKELIAFISNIVVAIVVLYLLNLSGFVHIDINIVTILVTAILGVPGVIILMILSICGVI